MSVYQETISKIPHLFVFDLRLYFLIPGNRAFDRRESSRYLRLEFGHLEI